mmetsp:Transcript_30411/g.91197  ORF Transcript_30411/g.91197 Transcript_30411/m.91197 type:complete len:122 (-) Transcript_30411:1138-1503(-)
MQSYGQSNLGIRELVLGDGRVEVVLVPLSTLLAKSAGESSCYVAPLQVLAKEPDRFKKDAVFLRSPSTFGNAWVEYLLPPVKCLNRCRSRLVGADSSNKVGDGAPLLTSELLDELTKTDIL